MEILKNKFKEFFSLDYRSLAFMRMGMGLTIMLDLIERSHSLVAHYTDIGTLSRADLLNLFGGQWFVSIYMASGLSWVIAALFIIAGIFALMMLVGYRTRLATIVSFFFLISLHARNPLVLQGGDVIFRIILLWMIFLPTGICWSVDRLLNRIAPAKNKMTISPATVAYIIQVILIYVMAGTFKTGIAWHDGTAVYYALSIDQLIRPAGAYLRSFTGICHFLTYYTVVLETYGSVLYFSPFYTGMFRTIGICLYALLQVGFNLSMHLGYFGMIAIVATLGLLPPYFWDNWMHSLHEFLKRRAKKGLSIY